LDRVTLDGLRQLAVQRGLITKRGPINQRNRGNIQALLKELVKEAGLSDRLIFIEERDPAYVYEEVPSG